MRFLHAITLSLLGTTISSWAQHPAGLKELAIGDTAPPFELVDTGGKKMNLSDFDKAKVFAVLFTSNHCPTSHAVVPRLIKLHKEMRSKGFEIVAINPNHPDGLRPDELGYSKYGDSYEEMKPYADEEGFTFPYLYDGDTQKTAMAYGCLATPQGHPARENIGIKGWYFPEQ